MPKFKSESVSLSYQLSGEGENLVLIHGMAANQAFWYPEIFTGLTTDYRTLIYDLRGHGTSGMPDKGYTTEDHAFDLKALLDDQKIQETHIVGHSLGAAIGLHFALMYPERVKTLSLLDCRLQLLQPIRQIEDDSYWGKKREELLAKGVTLAPDTPRIVYSMVDELAPLLQKGQEFPGLLGGLKLWDPATRSGRRWLELVQNTSFAEDLYRVVNVTTDDIADLKIPSYLLYGEDTNCMPTFEGLRQLMPEAEYELLPQKGHFFPLVDSKQTLRCIKSFLSRARP